MEPPNHLDIFVLCNSIGRPVGRPCEFRHAISPERVKNASPVQSIPQDRLHERIELFVRIIMNGHRTPLAALGKADLGAQTFAQTLFNRIRK